MKIVLSSWSQLVHERPLVVRSEPLIPDDAVQQEGVDDDPHEREDNGCHQGKTDLEEGMVNFQ